MLDRIIIASRLFRLYRRAGMALRPSVNRAWRVSK